MADPSMTPEELWESYASQVTEPQQEAPPRRRRKKRRNAAPEQAPQAPPASRQRSPQPRSTLAQLRAKLAHNETALAKIQRARREAALPGFSGADSHAPLFSAINFKCLAAGVGAGFFLGLWFSRQRRSS